MSRIGKLPVELPSGVECTIQGSHVKVKGPKGELVRDLHPEMLIEKEENQVLVKRPSDNRTHRALHGLTRALLNNMVVGVSQGYEKQLNIVGVGYKVELKGKALVLNLGYSHPIEYPSPDGIEFEVDSKANTIKVKGIDKEKVGQTSAEIRKMRPPEPYKGKGVMYADERIRRKAGKAAAGK
ncbi:50S ribosomal protein L6 [Nitrospina gracilis 3/211]|uniref:Large ribosomal subunit protein uL6 n=1 Tax=Nitrospina gracilis (strain 3/211) TaxID=1266370 RepID=M1YIK5_NITG3|nr:MULTISPECIES: 50S ribosomal protein L6 [Nitrospina]MCF8723273.1 large subunit ribosomal protein L6 [Nitrospina sp. Nb-3]CCQ90323.1 50S ribosomal protein L6 [Nitrospina gracilis 3/211]